jgi:hypothetical protein
MDKVNWFTLGMFVGGVTGIIVHAYITGTLFVMFVGGVAGIFVHAYITGTLFVQ